VAPDIVQEAFAEWTKGLSGRDARISIFDHIRDISYAVIPEISNPVDGPQGLLKGMKGSCHEYSGCPFRNDFESNEAPHGLPQRAHIFPSLASDAVVILASKLPPG
jgi:hypothetical protein